MACSARTAAGILKSFGKPNRLPRSGDFAQGCTAMALAGVAVPMGRRALACRSSARLLRSRPDSNRRPSARQADALTTELQEQVCRSLRRGATRRLRRASADLLTTPAGPAEVQAVPCVRDGRPRRPSRRRDHGRIRTSNRRVRSPVRCPVAPRDQSPGRRRVASTSRRPGLSTLDTPAGALAHVVPPPEVEPG